MCVNDFFYEWERERWIQKYKNHQIHVQIIQPVFLTSQLFLSFFMHNFIDFLFLFIPNFQMNACESSTSVLLTRICTLNFCHISSHNICSLVFSIILIHKIEILLQICCLKCDFNTFSFDLWIIPTTLSFNRTTFNPNFDLFFCFYKFYNIKQFLVELPVFVEQLIVAIIILLLSASLHEMRYKKSFTFLRFFSLNFMTMV